MKVFIKGKGEISLNPKDHIATGGEASVYAKAGTAYKIYTDPKKMIPAAKIGELAVLSNPNIIKPTDILLDQGNKPIGYTMRFVKDTYALCQLFTKAFRDREGLDHDMMLKLVQFLQGLVQNVHDHKILLVDLNELNFLTDKKFSEVYAIDVDSYQTKSFPATALMESVRDRHSKTFNENTDWFSFGIVSFMMFCGIHPYKGKATKYKSMEERMIHNISVFNKDVSVPAVCYPFDIIPQVMRDWYKAVFDDGKRLPPPKDLQAVVQIITRIVQGALGSNILDIKEIQTMTEEIVDVLFNNGLGVILTTKNIHVNRDSIPIPAKAVKVVLTPRSNSVILAWHEFGKLKLYNVAKRSELNLPLDTNEIMSYDGRLYCKSNGNIVEIIFSELANIIASSKIVGNCLEQASRVFDGMVIQNLLGACYASIFPASSTCYQIHIKELDAHQVVDAKFDNNVLMIVGTKGGQYDRFVIRFSPDYKDYDIRITNDCTHTGFNFVVLDSGVCVYLVEDGHIEIFSNKMGSASTKIIDDKTITTDMQLFKDGTKLMFARGNKLFYMTMKP